MATVSIEGLMNQLAAMQRRQEQVEQYLKSRMTSDAIPGPRIPYDLVLQVDIGANTTRVQVTEQVSDAGPMIVEQMIGAWKNNTSNKFGPFSSSASLTTHDVDSLDATWALTDTGTGIVLSNKDVPSAAVFSQDRPAYLAHEWLIKKNSSVKWEIQPTVAPANAGTGYMVLRGYRILTGALASGLE